MKRLINLSPTPVTRVFIGLLPFVLLLLVYIVASDARLEANPNDKLLPAMSSFVDAIDPECQAAASLQSNGRGH